ncbi:MAG: flagellar basal body M-ring protein FliF [Nitrosomonadales bacterium]|nr:MAG: flagellar basal body M-ring protein FliF [Nitrosomonadales bacterium]
MAEAPGQTLHALIAGFNELEPKRKTALMVAFAAVIAVIIGSVMWAQTPDYRTLYNNLSDRDGGAVIEALQKQNITFKTGEAGAIMVPSHMLYEARLKLAAQGLPRGGSVGFELLDNQKFGISQFQENINYQRALEGEITRTIEAISAVQGARVHLAIPKPTVFVREEQKPSASVLVSLYAGHSLDKSQVAGIVHLVASSVPEMLPTNVTVIDQSGNMLTSGRDKTSAAGLDSSQLEYLQEVEHNYAKRIEDILFPIIGPENVRAQVTADLDFSQTEQTAETYRPNAAPDQSSIRSQQTAETVDQGGQSATGVPGALSNQPPGAASAPINAPSKSGAAAGSASAGGSQHKEATVNYELDKTISHTRKQVGSIKRLSVAVVLNNKAAKDKKGKTSYRALTKDELTQAYNLVKEAMGFSQARGDSLNVVNAPFNLEAAEMQPLPIWKDLAVQGMAKDILKYLLISGLIFYIVLGVMRPLIQQIIRAGVDKKAAERAAAEEEKKVEYLQHKSKTAPRYEDDIALVKEMAKNEPKMVANVVKDWIG